MLWLLKPELTTFAYLPRIGVMASIFCHTIRDDIGVFLNPKNIHPNAYLPQ